MKVISVQSQFTEERKVISRRKTDTIECTESIVFFLP
jgi:hypothetical protein